MGRKIKLKGKSKTSPRVRKLKKSFKYRGTKRILNGKKAGVCVFPTIVASQKVVLRTVDVAATARRGTRSEPIVLARKQGTYYDRVGKKTNTTNTTL